MKVSINQDLNSIFVSLLSAIHSRIMLSTTQTTTTTTTTTTTIFKRTSRQLQQVMQEITLPLIAAIILALSRHRCLLSVIILKYILFQDGYIQLEI